MKKKDFVTLLLSVVGGLLFAIGMCMALIPEWNAMKPGIVVAAVGIAVLLIMVMVHRKMSGRAAIQFNLKTIGITRWHRNAAVPHPHLQGSEIIILFRRI